MLLQDLCATVLDSHKDSQGENHAAMLSPRYGFHGGTKVINKAVCAHVQDFCHYVCGNQERIRGTRGFITHGSWKTKSDQENGQVNWKKVLGYRS